MEETPPDGKPDDSKPEQPKFDSPAIRRLIEEVRLGISTDKYLHDRQHNRHNRS